MHVSSPHKCCAGMCTSRRQHVRLSQYGMSICLNMAACLSVSIWHVCLSQYGSMSVCLNMACLSVSIWRHVCLSQYGMSVCLDMTGKFMRYPCIISPRNSLVTVIMNSPSLSVRQLLEIRISYTHICAYTTTCTHIHLHIYTYTYTNTHAHTHTHIHMQYLFSIAFRGLPDWIMDERLQEAQEIATASAFASQWVALVAPFIGAYNHIHVRTHIVWMWTSDYKLLHHNFLGVYSESVCVGYDVRLWGVCLNAHRSRDLEILQ